VLGVFGWGGCESQQARLCLRTEAVVAKGRTSASENDDYRVLGDYR